VGWSLPKTKENARQQIDILQLPTGRNFQIDCPISLFLVCPAHKRPIVPSFMSTYHVSRGTTGCRQQVELFLVNDSRQPKVGNEQLAVLGRGLEQQVLWLNRREMSIKKIVFDQSICLPSLCSLLLRAATTKTAAHTSLVFRKKKKWEAVTEFFFQSLPFWGYKRWPKQTKV